MAFVCGERSAHRRSNAPPARRIQICHGSPRWSAMRSAPRRPASPAGIVATITNHAMRSSGDCDATTRHGAQPRTYESHEVAPEVCADRDERSEVQRDVERLVEAVVLLEIRPLGRPRNEDEVP